MCRKSLYLRSLRHKVFNRLLNSGEGGIRTRGKVLPLRRFSKPVQPNDFGRNRGA